MLRTLPVYFHLALLCALIATNMNIYTAVFAPRALSVSVLEVGKGSAVLVRSPGAKTLLIDTGPDAGILRALGGSLPEWQRNIDQVALTSKKASFSGGMRDLESRYHILSKMSIGDQAAPYGTTFAFDGGARVTIASPGTFSIIYGTHSLTVSSTTPPKTYVFK